MSVDNAFRRLTEGPFFVKDAFPKFRLFYPKTTPEWGRGIFYRDDAKFKDLTPQEQEWCHYVHKSPEPPFTPVHNCSDCTHDVWEDE